MFLTPLYYIFLFVLGTAVGSFTSAAIYRLHTREHSLLHGRSYCPQCKTSLKPKDLVPLLSYLALRGKCRYCNKEISYMYPLLELSTGVLFAFLFLKFPFFDENLVLHGPELLKYLLFAFYTFVLVFTFFYDLRYLSVADEILLPGILIGFVATLGATSVHLIDALFGAVLAVAFFGLQILVSKGKWVGAGDLRIGAFMGVILGWKLLIVALVLSYLIGSLMSIVIILKKKKFFGVKIPFAPFLVTGTLLVMFFGEQILDWYLHTLLGF